MVGGGGGGGGDNDEAEIGSDRTRRLFADHLMTVNGFVIVRQEINSESNKRSDTKSLRLFGNNKYKRSQRFF